MLLTFWIENKQKSSIFHLQVFKIISPGKKSFDSNVCESAEYIENIKWI